MRLSHLLHIDGTASVRVNGGKHLLDARLLLVVQYPRLCATTSVSSATWSGLLAASWAHKCSCAARTFELVICAMSFRSSHSAAQPLSARGVCSSGQGMMRTCLLFRIRVDKQVAAVLRVLPRPARRGRHAALLVAAGPAQPLGMCCIDYTRSTTCRGSIDTGSPPSSTWRPLVPILPRQW